MKGELQLDRKPPPSHFVKQQTGLSILQIIRMKKAEFAKQLESLEAGQISLPHIANQKLDIQNSKDLQSKKAQERSNGFEQAIDNGPHTPESIGVNKFKTILDQFYEMQKAKGPENILMRSKLIKQSKNQQKIMQMLQNKANRTKTETKSRDFKRITESKQATSIQKSKIQPEDTQQQIQQHIYKFQTCVQTIPKNMKMRNQENLTDTIVQLQHFNPFFNRNPRIVNVCLLKMGKIVLKASSTVMYRAGEQLDHFYIILQGKIKLVEGNFRRLCQTGETVLQEVIFSEKIKKLSLEKAKTISDCYLLELKIQEYKKLKEELIRHGLKLGWQEMQAIIKRNFIIKNWMRNKKKN